MDNLVGKTIVGIGWDETELAWLITFNDTTQEHVRFLVEQRSKVEDKFAELCETGAEVNKLVPEVERLEKAAARLTHVLPALPGPNEDEPRSDLAPVYSLRLRIEAVADALLRLDI